MRGGERQGDRETGRQGKEEGAAQRNRSAFFSSKYPQSLPVRRDNKQATSEKDVSQALKCKILVLCGGNMSSMWGMACSHEKCLRVRKPGGSALNFDAAPMSSLCFSFCKAEAVMLPFFSKAAWGWFWQCCRISRAALSAGCWQCPCSCQATGTPWALQRLQLSGMGNCGTQFTRGKGWSQANSKYSLQDIFHKPSRRRPTPFLIRALLSPSAIYAHLHFGTLKHPLEAWAMSGRALQGHLPQNVLIIFYSHLAGQRFTLMLPSVDD